MLKNVKRGDFSEMDKQYISYVREINIIIPQHEVVVVVLAHYDFSFLIKDLSLV